MNLSGLTTPQPLPRLERSQFHHRGQSLTFAHRQLSSEDSVNDIGWDAGDLIQRLPRHGLVEDHAHSAGRDPKRVFDSVVEFERAVVSILSPNEGFGLTFGHASIFRKWSSCDLFRYFLEVVRHFEQILSALYPIERIKLFQHLGQRLWDVIHRGANFR